MVQGSNFHARIADNKDPLRGIVEAARAWHVPPSVFMGESAITTYTYDHAGRVVRAEVSGWSAEDREAALALLHYEADFCPGGPHPLAETTKVEHTGAYRPEPPIRCHYCTTQAAVSKAQQDNENSVGLLYPITLDEAVVELNKQPVPPLPPELGG